MIEYAEAFSQICVVGFFFLSGFEANMAKSKYLTKPNEEY